MVLLKKSSILFGTFLSSVYLYNVIRKKTLMNKYDGNGQKQDLITEKLKALYTSVQEEEIPDKFLQMLDQLDEAEKAMDTASQDKNKNG